MESPSIFCWTSLSLFSFVQFILKADLLYVMQGGIIYLNLLTFLFIISLIYFSQQ